MRAVINRSALAFSVMIGHGAAVYTFAPDLATSKEGKEALRVLTVCEVVDEAAPLVHMPHQVLPGAIVVGLETPHSCHNGYRINRQFAWWLPYDGDISEKSEQ
jgi:hypothetical protein